MINNDDDDDDDGDDDYNDDDDDDDGGGWWKKKHTFVSIVQFVTTKFSVLLSALRKCTPKGTIVEEIS